MGFGVGVTFMTGNRAGVRSKTDAHGRALGHQGDARALLCELAEERWSATQNLDRTRSNLNEYGVGGLGRFRSGQEAYEYLCEQVADYDRRAKADAIAEGRRPPRAVRSDAPVMVSVIVEPEAEYMATLSDTDKERLMRDCVLALVECGYIDDPGDVLVSTIHKDEGAWHPTIAFINRDPSTGRIGTSRYNDCRKMDLLHREFLGCLRAKGWDVEGHDTVDRERLKTDLDYKADRKRKRRNQGKSANAYAAEQAEKKARQRADAANREADEAAERLDAILAAERSHVEAEREARESAAQAAADARAACERALEAVVDEDVAVMSRDEANAALAEVTADVDAKTAELAQVKERLSDATAREGELERRESAVTAREDAAQAKERELDKRDKTPKTVTVEKDTPETLAEVKRLRAFRASVNSAYSETRDALAKEELVPMEAWGTPRIGDVFKRLVTMVKTWAGRALTAERERDELALENAQLRDELRAKSRDVSGSLGYAPDVDEGSGNEYGR